MEEKPGRLPWHEPQIIRLPDHSLRARAKLNTRYTTAGIDYDLQIWENGLIIIQFVDRRGKTRTQWYHSKDEFNEEWEEL